MPWRIGIEIEGMQLFVLWNLSDKLVQWITGPRVTIDGLNFLLISSLTFLYFFKTFFPILLSFLTLFDFVIDEPFFLLSFFLHVVFHFSDSDFEEIEFVV